MGSVGIEPAPRFPGIAAGPPSDGPVAPAPGAPGIVDKPPSGARAPVAPEGPPIPEEDEGADDIAPGEIPPPAGKDDGAGWAAQGVVPAQTNSALMTRLKGRVDEAGTGPVDNDPPPPRIGAFMGLPS